MEEFIHGRLLRLSTDGDIAWQYVDRTDTGRVYRMNWSRVPSRDLTKTVLESIGDVECS